MSAGYAVAVFAVGTVFGMAIAVGWAVVSDWLLRRDER